MLERYAPFSRYVRRVHAAHPPWTLANPGIHSLFRFRPETARPLNELVDVLLRGPSALTPGAG